MRAKILTATAKTIAVHTAAQSTSRMGGAPVAENGSTERPPESPRARANRELGSRYQIAAAAEP